MNFENIMLSEEGQAQKATHGIIPFIWNVHSRQIYRDRESISSCQELREGENEERLLMGIEFLYGVLKFFWNYIIMMVSCEPTEKPLSWTVCKGEF